MAASLFGVLSAILLVGLTIWLAPYLLALTSALPSFGPLLLVFSFLVSVGCSLALSCFISRGKRHIIIERRPEDEDDSVNTGGRPGRPGLCRERWQLDFIKIARGVKQKPLSFRPRMMWFGSPPIAIQAIENVVVRD